MEYESKIALKGTGLSLSEVPLISYKINGSRNTSKASGVTSQVNQFFIDLEIPHGQGHESFFLLWFGSDSADLKGEITTPGSASFSSTHFGSNGYLFDKGKVHSFEKVYDRAAHNGQAPYVLKIGIVAERLGFDDVTVDRNGTSEDKIFDEFNFETPDIGGMR